MHGGLGFQNILLRFDQEQIRAALNQPDRLFAEDLGQFFKGDVTQCGIVCRGEQTTRTDGACHEARQTGVACKSIGGTARHCGRRLIDLEDAILQAVFAQRDPVRSECIRLDRFSAGCQKRRVDRLNNSGPRNHQIVVAAVERFAAEIDRA